MLGLRVPQSAKTPQQNKSHTCYPACQRKPVRRGKEPHRSLYGKIRSGRSADGVRTGSVPTSDEDTLSEVLRRIEASDGGLSLAAAEQSSINELLSKLEESGRQQQPRPLDNPEIFGNFNVAYSSTQRAPEQDRQPAGGWFRGRLARRAFQATRLCQSVIQPDLVTNKVEFLLFGSLRGSVGLRGKLEAVDDDKATVKVFFEPPRLTFGNILDLVIGPKSIVVLTTTYLTPTVRLGKGSRGSLFVFTKGGAADSADMETVGLGKTKAAGWLWLSAGIAALTAAAAGLWKTSLFGKIVAVLPALLALFLGQAAAAAQLRQEGAA